MFNAIQSRCLLLEMVGVKSTEGDGAALCSVMAGGGGRPSYTAGANVPTFLRGTR